MGVKIMGTITIDYSEINSAAKKAKSVSGYYEDFADELENKVTKKLNSLPGYDSKGNVANARTIVSAKVKNLRSKKTHFSSLAVNLEKLADKIEEHEKNVVSGVRRIATGFPCISRIFCSIFSALSPGSIISISPVSLFLRK